MSSFTLPLIVEIQQGQRDGKGLAKLVQGFSYDVGYLGSNDTVSVPAGYVTDFTSSPRWGRWLVSNFDKYAKAAVIHDWLVESKSRPRKDADHIFHEALLVLECPKWKAWIMWFAVRINGILKSI